LFDGGDVTAIQMRAQQMADGHGGEAHKTFSSSITSAPPAASSASLPGTGQLPGRAEAIYPPPGIAVARSRSPGGRTCGGGQEPIRRSRSCAIMKSRIGKTK